MTPAELAEHFRAWKQARGLTNETAAEVLGVPKRTLDEIPRRGFPYPKLLMLGMGLKA